MFSKIIRDNKEIEYIANNKYYDFNYQYTNFLQKPVVLKRVIKLLERIYVFRPNWKGYRIILDSSRLILYLDSYAWAYSNVDPNLNLSNLL